MKSTLSYFLYCLVFILVMGATCTEKKDRISKDKSILKSVSKVEGTTEIYKGMNLEAPPRPFKAEEFNPLIKINCNYVSVIPYAFLKKSTGEVIFNHPNQWWGEGIEGVEKSIDMAVSKGLKVMVKPHVWVDKQGWAGDLKLQDEALSVWKKEYKKYILTYAELAQKKKVEVFCIGTEYRHLITHIDYWTELIASIRAVYNGKLTYAANWDNYENVMFWKQLDIIGIDAYFPLKKKNEPLKAKILLKNTRKIKQVLDTYTAKQKKQYIFTEYGFKSLKNTSEGHWDTNKKEVDEKEQALCFEVFQQVFSPDEQFRGGFIWKWHLSGMPSRHGYFTPQGKTAMKSIEKAYSKW